MANICFHVLSLYTILNLFTVYNVSFTFTYEELKNKCTQLKMTYRNLHVFVAEIFTQVLILIEA